MDVYQITGVSKAVSADPYVGRGIIIGKTADGKKAAVAYFIMGRSDNSRNRIFKEVGDEVMIQPFDVSKVEDPSLIIYWPVRKHENHLIVTNGDQTDTIYGYLKEGKTFEEALETRAFEPDAPNFTPRISGMLTFEKDEFSYKMSILKSGDKDGTVCNRYHFSFSALNGLGHFIHTYAGDGNPLPTFQGEPERILVPDDIDGFTKEIWENLDEKNKISLYVRYIDLKTGEMESRMINKNQ